MSLATTESTPERVLHVVVGHGLPGLYRNTLRSFRLALPTAPLLVVDNASPQVSLRAELGDLAAGDEQTNVILRDRNELDNGKVGGLYSAYALAFDHAVDAGFAYVHLLQADMQVLWWDERALLLAQELFDRHPGAVNIQTMALSSDRWLTGDVASDERTGDCILTRYGLTDTGLYHLQRWQERNLAFGPTEEAHAAGAYRKGCRVPLLRAPTEVQVPWPAVVRNGRQVGAEVSTSNPLLCRPVEPAEVVSMLDRRDPARLEEICRPWGWLCLSPMWNTDLGELHYWALRRLAVRTLGWRAGLPRIVGSATGRPWRLLKVPHRPTLRLVVRQSLPAAVAHVMRWRRHPASSFR